MLTRDNIITIGNFDGCHLGHQELFRKVLEFAEQNAKSHCIVSFDPSSRCFFYPQTAPIYSQQQNRCRMNGFGVKNIIFQKFDSAFAQMSREDFIHTFLIQKLGAHHIVVGHDFRFAKNREGSTKDLQAAGLQVTTLDALMCEGVRVSSSWIRTLIQNGNTSLAHKALGSPYCMWGVSVRGDGIARTLGFPTCNLETPQTCLPKDGVYAGRVTLDAWSMNPNNPEASPAVLHVNSNGKIEAHIIDLRATELYDRKLSFFFLQRLRDNYSGISANDLKVQIDNDIKNVRALQ